MKKTYANPAIFNLSLQESFAETSCGCAEATRHEQCILHLETIRKALRSKCGKLRPISICTHFLGHPTSRSVSALSRLFSTAFELPKSVSFAVQCPQICRNKPFSWEGTKTISVACDLVCFLPALACKSVRLTEPKLICEHRRKGWSN